MYLQVALYVCLAAFAVNLVYGQVLSGEQQMVVNQINELNGALNKTINNLTASVNGGLTNLTTDLRRFVNDTQKATGLILLLPTNIRPLIDAVFIDAVTPAVNGLTNATSQFGKALDKIYTDVITGITNAASGVFDAFADLVFNFITGVVITLEKILNDWSAIPFNVINSLLSFLGGSRQKNLKTMETSVPMMCSFQANPVADDVSRATVTATLQAIRAAMKEIKLGKCNGLACLTLIPLAQKIAQDALCG